VTDWAGAGNDELAGAALPEPARNALEEYAKRFAHTHTREPVIVAWAPGRVNLIGEHTDYNDGYVLPLAVDRYVGVAGSAVEGNVMQVFALHQRQSVQIDLATLPFLAADLPLWARYVRAVMAGVERESQTPSCAWAGVIAGDVPVGGGMSSSAALSVAVAHLAMALAGTTFDPLRVARLCQRAEDEGAGVQVGLMDPAISCLGEAGHALLLDCRSLEYRQIPLNAVDLSIAVFDTGVPHTLAGSAYNERRHQCEASVSLLASLVHAEDAERDIRSLRDITPVDLDRLGWQMPLELLRRARHVVSENVRVLAAAEALEQGDLERLGSLLYASHASLRDDYQVSCAELDLVVDIARSVEGVLGARMMGAGFGGSALVLVREESVQQLAQALEDRYPAESGRKGTLHICHASDGACVLKLPAGDGKE